MQPWLETIGVLILACIGIILGLATTKLKSRIWFLIYFLPLILVCLIGLTRHLYWLVFYIPFSWLTAGRMEYIIFAFTIPMIFSILIPRLPVLRQKLLLGTFVMIVSVLFFILPFIVPFFIRNELKQIKTSFLENGICYQTTDYTCGPASAVTALNQLGIIANEGELAINAYTTPQTGTSDDLLKNAIEKLYGSEGVTCTYRRFDSVEQLEGNCPVIVVTKYTFFIDHYVAVMHAANNKVIIGDPSVGMEILTYDDFEKRWRSVGIVIKKLSIAENQNIYKSGTI